METQLIIKGADRVRRRLERLPGSKQRQIVRRAINLASLPLAREMRKQIRQVSKKQEGDLRTSVRRVSRTVSGGFIKAIGPLHNKAPHQHLVDEGTEPRFRARLGASEKERKVRRAEGEDFRLAVRRAVRAGERPPDAGAEGTGLRSTGIMPVLPFGNPAFEAKADATMDIAMSEILDGLLDAF